MRGIDYGLLAAILVAYGCAAGLVILGALTLVIALFTGDSADRLGGFGVIVVALALAGATYLSAAYRTRSLR